MPLRAVIFDYGMVLCGPANPLAHQRMLELTQLDHPVFEQNYWQHRLDYDRGTFHGLSYWEAFARTSATPLDTTVIERLREQDILLWTDLNATMLAWVRAVQAAGFRTAILSNMGVDILAHMRRNFAWLEAFDHLTWSCELKMAKPDPQIYQHTLDKLGVRAEEALFIDDLLHNGEAARQVGMHALQFHDVDTLRDDIAHSPWAAELPAL